MQYAHAALRRIASVRIKMITLFDIAAIADDFKPESCAKWPRRIAVTITLLSFITRQRATVRALGTTAVEY